MAKTTQKKYQYKTKAIQLPDGTRKYLRGKTQEELDEKVLKAQILVNSGVDNLQRGNVRPFCPDVV